MDSIPITPRGHGCIYDEKALGCLISYPICLIRSSHGPTDVTSFMSHTLVADGTVPEYILKIPIVSVQFLFKGNAFPGLKQVF